MPGVLFVCREADLTAVPNVVVRLYDDSDVFQSQVITDADGEAEFLAVAEGDYTARFYMGSPGFSIESPQSLTVAAGADDSFSENTFDITVTLFSRPVSTDPRLCTCSGHFVDASGAPLPNVTVRLRNILRPLFVDAKAVLGDSVEVVTDGDGYAQVNLIRTAVYRVDIESLSDLAFEIRVPDELSANLPDVLFPVVSAVSFSPASLSMDVGDEETVDVTVVYRSGLQVELTDFASGDAPVAWESSDSDVATVSTGDSGLSVVAVGTGSATITPVRVLDNEDSFVQAVPEIGSISGSLSVTVA